MQLCCRFYGRPARISSGTDNHIGVEFFYNPPCLKNGCGSINKCLHILERELASEALHLYGMELISCLRDKLSLKTVCCTYKFYHRIRFSAFYFIGNGKSGVDMTARTAAAH